MQAAILQHYEMFRVSQFIWWLNTEKMPLYSKLQHINIPQFSLVVAP